MVTAWRAMERPHLRWCWRVSRALCRCVAAVPRLPGCAVTTLQCRARVRVYLCGDDIVRCAWLGVARRSSLVARHWPMLSAQSTGYVSVRASCVSAYHCIGISVCIGLFAYMGLSLPISVSSVCVSCGAEKRDPDGTYVPGARVMLQGSGTANFPAGEKLTAGSWKAAFSEIGRAEPYIYGAALCVIAGRRWHVCGRCRCLKLTCIDAHVCVQLSRATCSRTRRSHQMAASS